MRKVPIHQCATRANQLIGADRELVILTVLLAALMMMALVSISGVVASIAFFAIAVKALQAAGKADPLLRSVYLRHVTYEAFYPAKSGLHSQRLRCRMEWIPKRII